MYCCLCQGWSNWTDHKWSVAISSSTSATTPSTIRLYYWRLCRAFLCRLHSFERRHSVWVWRRSLDVEIRSADELTSSFACCFSRGWRHRWIYTVRPFGWLQHRPESFINFLHDLDCVLRGHARSNGIPINEHLDHCGWHRYLGAAPWVHSCLHEIPI